MLNGNTESFKIFSNHTYAKPTCLNIDNATELTVSEKTDTTSNKWKTLANSFNLAKASTTASGETTSFSALKRFKDGAIPITYKEGYKNGKPTSNLLTHHIIAERYKKLLSQQISSPVLEEGHLLTNDAPYTGLTLIKTAEKKWFIYDSVSKTAFPPEPQQKYIFVTMPDKTIRVAPEQQGGHSLLSNNARYVRYAGVVSFDDKQRIAAWNNQSGAYYPSPFLANQAKFEDGLSRFEAKFDRNVIENTVFHQSSCKK